MLLIATITPFLAALTFVAWVCDRLGPPASVHRAACAVEREPARFWPAPAPPSRCTAAAHPRQRDGRLLR